MRRPAQALVEFALAVSVFMFLVLGTFDLAQSDSQQALARSLAATGQVDFGCLA